MNVFSKFSLFILVYGLVPATFSFDPFSIGAAVTSIGYHIYLKSWCKFKECCTENEIPADFEKLKRNLQDRVYGQHLVQDTVLNALKAHWIEESPKALTLSFHGSPGCGKNYVTSFIKDSLYKLGSDSSHVHNFLGRIHFPLEEKTEEYKASLYHWVKGNVSRCARQLFIFDEVDKMPPKILNVLKPIIDYNHKVEGVDYRKAVFIFLSNTGASLITDHFIKLWRSGVRRDEIKLKDFETLITQGAFNEEGGFHHSDTIKSNLIDHYIPFLPLEHEHIILCIKDEFSKRNVTKPSEQYVQEVLESVEWGPQPHNLFSKTGCKRLSQKVALIIQKHELYRN